MMILEPTDIFEFCGREHPPEGVREFEEWACKFVSKVPQEHRERGCVYLSPHYDYDGDYVVVAEVGYWRTETLDEFKERMLTQGYSPEQASASIKAAEAKALGTPNDS